MATSLLQRVVQRYGAARVLSILAPQEQAALRYCWPAWARPEQIPPPGDWLTWLLLSGRGTGKTRTGAEFIRAEVAAGRAGRVALVERTPADARDVMVEGESGLLAVHPESERPVYEPSKRRLTWPNGAIATVYTSWEPDMLRGPQHDLAWCEELASWKYARETWDNLLLGLRLGQHPRMVVTTTPRPIALLKEIMAAPTTVVTRGTTYDNLVNLAPSFRAQVVARYEGTRLGRQELYGELLDDMPGALWTRVLIERGRVQKAPEMARVVVAVDPSATGGPDADECGIVAAGKGMDGAYYVLADRSARLSPDGWARRVVQAYRDYRADRVVYEANQGGDMVALTLRTVERSLPLHAVHASRGKRARAEPIAALYEQGQVHHVGMLADLEDQICSWTPESGESPDRLDALVWAVSALMSVGSAIPLHV